jgi:hypothetical protein
MSGYLEPSISVHLYMHPKRGTIRDELEVARLE